MGKVKEKFEDAAKGRGCKYQFPVGKVKRDQYHLLMYLLKVSIPYGKGKV